MKKNMDFWGGIKPLPVKKGPKNKPTEWNWVQTKKALPHIKKWGDLDMDGSPNWLDCRPLNPSKDGVLSDLKEKFMSRIKGTETEVSVKGKKKKKYYEKKKRWYDVETDKPKKRFQFTRAVGKRELVKHKDYTREKPKWEEKLAPSVRMARKLKQIEAGQTPTQQRLLPKVRGWVERERAQQGKGYQQLKQSLPERLARAAVQGPGMAARRLGSVTSMGRSRAHVGQLVQTLTGVPTGTGKTFKRIYKGGKGSGRGRPSGTWKYSIPGKGRVPVQVYKAWIASEKAKYKMEGQEGREQQPIQYKAYEESRRYEPAVRTAVVTDEGVVEVQRPAMEVRQPEEVPYEREATGEPALHQTMDQQAYDRSREQQVQESENPLHAPSISRGELQGLGAQRQFVGGPVGSHILQAPNINKGEMREDYYRDPGQYGSEPFKEPVQDWDTIERPINNPYGDEYTDIDPASGRPILRRRIKERWISPDAA